MRFLNLPAWFLAAGALWCGCYQAEGDATQDTAAGASDAETDAPGTDDTVSVDTETEPGDPILPEGCGNGLLEPTEVCDDGNTEGGDGCSADCSYIEGWEPCTTPECIVVHRCGDGQRSLPEMCDDGNLLDGDGCSRACQVELGFKCEGMYSVCTPTVCGDGIQEGAETCDDGNVRPGDGCSPLCIGEPDCSGGAACTSECGDRVLTAEEACDDGNRISGDGCSESCSVEAGYTCEPDPATLDPSAVPAGRSECLPTCGDGVVTPPDEECDDGDNDGGYGECAPGCVFGLYCGDGVVQPEYEECDDGNFRDNDGCSVTCRTIGLP